MLRKNFSLSLSDWEFRTTLGSRDDFVCFWHLAAGFSVLERKCEKEASELSLSGHKFQVGSHLSLSRDNSGEASIPKSALSPISDTKGMVARSSTELQVDPMLPFFEEKIIGVASVLLTSTRALGSEPVSGDCSAKSAKQESSGEGNNREDEVGVLCEGEVSGGSSNVRKMTCARHDECFGDNAHKEQCNVS